MADSIREQIEKNLVSTLEGVKTSAGYGITVRKVERYPIIGLNIIEFPTVAIVPTEETKQDGIPVQFTTCNLMVDLVCWNRKTDSNDAVSEANLILANVEKALKVDVTRGGKAHDTNLTGNSFILPFDVVPHGGVILHIMILYRHRLNDPFSQ